jgi:hypothetical protein
MVEDSQAGCQDLTRSEAGDLTRKDDRDLTRNAGDFHTDQAGDFPGGFRTVGGCRTDDQGLIRTGDFRDFRTVGGCRTDDQDLIRIDDRDLTRNGTGEPQTECEDLIQNEDLLRTWG